MEMGKAYANRKEEKDRPKGDLYHTPKSLVRELLKVENFNYPWECACGDGAITDVFKEHGMAFCHTDISTGTNFLDQTHQHNGDIMTNPPFSLWDDFVMKGKEFTKNKLCLLGRTNYFGTHSRYSEGIWENLSKVYVFNRYVDYQTPKRDDGLFCVGVLCTGWFIWEKGYTGDPIIKIMDVQKYAKLGQFRNCNECEYNHMGHLSKCDNCIFSNYGIKDSVISNFKKMS